MEADFQQYYGLDISSVKLSRGSRLMFQLPRGCRLFAVLDPASQWGWSEILANKANYLLETLVWQNSYDHKKKAKSDAAKPKPFLPEFMKEPPKKSAINEGSIALDTSDIKSLLELPRA